MGADAGELPLALIATTVNVYVTPLVRFGTPWISVAFPLAWPLATMPPPFAVMVYAQLLRAAAAGANRPAPSGATVAECREHFARRDHLNHMAENAEQRAAQMVAWQARQHTKLPD